MWLVATILENIVLDLFIWIHIHLIVIDSLSHIYDIYILYIHIHLLMVKFFLIANNVSVNIFVYVSCDIYTRVSLSEYREWNFQFVGVSI